MRIVVNTPTGKIGSQVTDTLLNDGHELTVIHRQPDKLRGLSQRGVHIVEGSADDPAVVGRAVDGADCVFWLTPPQLAVDDPRASQNVFGDAAARAFEKAGTQRLVNVSSVGANLPSGTGPIAGLHDIEHKFNSAVPNVVNLRPAYFMENFFASLPEIVEAGRISLPVDGKRRFPLIATRDIAADAARRLADPRWEGQQVQHLLGAQDLSFNQVAEQLGSAIDRELSFQPLVPDQERERLLQAGFTPGLATAYLEMYDWFDRGLPGAELDRSPSTNTSTTFAQFAREVFRPAYIAALRQAQAS